MPYTKPAFQLPFGVLNISQEPVDVRYGPYTGIGIANGETFGLDSALTRGNRHIGLTIGIVSSGVVTEYWFKSGTSDADLVEKTSGGSGSGDKTFIFYQTLNTTKWEITHNLGKNPSVTVIDTGGTEIVGEIKYINSSKVEITFSIAVNGTAYLN